MKLRTLLVKLFRQGSLQGSLTIEEFLFLLRSCGEKETLADILESMSQEEGRFRMSVNEAEERIKETKNAGAREERVYC